MQGAAGRTADGSVEVVSVGVYDAQDRLLTYGAGAGVPEDGVVGDSIVFEGYHSYAYTANGELTSRTLGSPDTTVAAGAYTYDAMGALLRAVVPVAASAETLSYSLDGQNCRVAQYRGGEFERGWLYEGISVAAELSDSVTLARRYVYGTRDHVPDLMWDADSALAYRLVTDHLGSVRAVVRLTDGAIVQRTDYGAWGEVTAETNADLQSLGFAGGLRERTTGLVRFGARDYDPTVGRWTSKDPIGFGGGSLSLLEYAESNPGTFIDPTGLSVVGDEDVPIDVDGDVLLECLREVLGIKDVLLVLGPAGLPLIKKPFAAGGSTHTSPLSVGLRKVLGKARVPGGRLPAPTYAAGRASSSKIATVLGRWAPLFGWGLTAFDIGRVVECYREKLAGRCSLGIGAR